jgi:transposase
MSLANPGWRRAWSDSLPVTAISWMMDQGRCPVAEGVNCDERRLARSRHPPPGDGRPEQTLQVAGAALPPGPSSRRRRAALGPLSMHPQVAPRLSHPARPARAPAQLARSTLRPWADGRSDAQAAEAGRARIDGEDALALEVTAPGGAAAVLSAFRRRLLTGQADLLLGETRRTRCRAPGWRKAQGRQRPASTQGLAALQPGKRLEGRGATLRHARHGLAPGAPAGRQSWGPAVWGARARPRGAAARLPPATPARDPLALPRGMGGRPRLGASAAPATPAWLRELPAIQPRRRVWRHPLSASPEAQPVRWRPAGDLPPAPLRIRSPDDPEARDGPTRETAGTGDQGPRTDTCADATPTPMTAVLSTPATTAAVAVRPTLQDPLATRQVPPRAPCVEAGDVRAGHLLPSRTEQGRARLGPVPGAQRWPGQAKNGFAAATLGLDWEAEHASCPHGPRRGVWRERPDRHAQAAVRLAFSQPGGAACASRAAGPRAARAPRARRMRDHAPDPVLQEARAWQQTASFTQGYARRAGLEGPMAQGTRRGDRRRSRDLGWGKTRLRQLLLAAALNGMRVAARLAAIPRAQTRPSAFAALAAAS